MVKYGIFKIVWQPYKFVVVSGWHFHFLFRIMANKRREVESVQKTELSDILSRDIKHQIEMVSIYCR